MSNTVTKIVIKGAREHNLKNISVEIPRDKLITITGLSGSGKSSLAFDTIYAEGQRRYVESLSAYARQFLDRMRKPDVDLIEGLSPAISIEQKSTSHNPRSTVGTSTEIFDYLKLLFARIGKTYSPISGKRVKKHTVSDVIHHVRGLSENTRLLLLAPISVDDKDVSILFKLLGQQGYARLKMNGKIVRIDDGVLEKISVDEIKLAGKENKLHLVVDRIVVKKEDDFYNRLADSIGTAFFEGNGNCYLENLTVDSISFFSNN